MELKLFQDSEKEIWDAFVRESEHGTIFHTWDWLKIVERHSVKKVLGKTVPATLHPLAVSDKSGIIGIFPVFTYDIPFFRTVASPPFGVETHNLGPVLRRSSDLAPESQQLLFLDFFREIEGYIRKNLQPRFVIFHTSPGCVSDTRPFRWSGYDVGPRYTYRLSLKAGKDGIWKQLARNLKREVTKAEKMGITVREGTEEDLLHIYNLLKDRERIVPSQQFLGDLFAKFYPGNFRIFIACNGDERLSGITVLTYKDIAYFWVGSPKYMFQGVSPNILVVWQSIQWAMENGYSWYEIVGADDMSLFPFKRKFNASLIIYFSARWLSPVFSTLASAQKIIRNTRE